MLNKVKSKKLTKKIFLILLSICFITITFAQSSRQEKKENRNKKIAALIKQNEEGLMVYNKHLAYGPILHTNGIGAFIEKGIRQDRRKTSLYRIELAEVKHNREEKSAGGFLGASSPTVFAKLNNVFQLNLSYGYQYMLGSKGNKNGIEVSAVGIGGLSLAFLKPYYFDVKAVTGGTRKRVTFDSGDTAVYEISSASGFGYGFNEMKLKPGAFVKAALRFEYGRDNTKINAIDIGLFTNFYAAKIPQLSLIKKEQLFFGAYLSMVFGKRK